MSMPELPNLNKFPTMEQAITAIITSIALEEIALSHVINAESEKIKLIVNCAKDKGCENMDPEELLAVNSSVADVLKSIVQLQVILKEKLEIASNIVPPAPPPPPPPPPCKSKFTTPSDNVWRKGNLLCLSGKTGFEPCKDGVRLIQKKCDSGGSHSSGISFNICKSDYNPCPHYTNCESLIQLPQGKSFDILFELEAVNKDADSEPVKIEAEFRSGDKIVHKETFVQEKAGKNVKMSHQIKYDTPASKDNSVALRLISPEKLYHVVASITILLNTGS